MHPHTLDTHFAYGYGGAPFDCSLRTKDTPLWCTYSRATREPKSFEDEVTVVAGILSEEAGHLKRKPIVLLSGGMDSEVVLRGCLAAGIEFEAITFRFKNGLNNHELVHVAAAVAKYGIKHSYYDIDIVAWLKTSEFEDLFHGAMAGSINLLPHMKLMNHIWFELNGMPVLGNGDLYLENEGGWNYVELEYMLGWFRHAVRFGVLGGIGFFQHTPEIVLAMMREPKILKLGHNEDEYANRMYETSKFVKYGIYRKFWPDFNLRPKLGGHEMVKNLYLKREAELLSDREVWDQKFIVSYDDFRAQLEPTGTACRQAVALQLLQTDS